MPIYEYECKRCSLRFELKRRFSEDGSGFCPQCGSEARHLLSPVPIIFKGAGFYVTDSRKSNDRFSDKGDGDKSDCKKESETKKP
jgi:putative FmdB family regulatory protein